ncbi:MAG: hypothetical protein LC121_03120 [Anaerolineae bacterium]|nr:hypothetical protein [Anaerolineae bacterium]
MPFGKAIIDATRDLVFGYVFDLAAYLALGAAGAIALERTVAYARAGGSAAILHGAFVGAAYVSAAAAFGVTDVTLATNDVETEAAYLAAGIGVFHFGDDAGAFAVLVQTDGERRLQVVGSGVIGAHRGEDFAAKIRAALRTDQP